MKPSISAFQQKLRHTKAPVFCVYYATLPVTETSQAAIAVVAVHQLKTQQTRLFSLQLMAQRLGLDVTAGDSQRAILEKELLDEWLCYLERMQVQHPESLWVHWGGWTDLILRCQRLLQRPFPIVEEQAFDLASDVAKPFGQSRQLPKLLKLAELNRLVYREALTGREERILLSQHQYQDVVQSVICKVQLIGRLTHLLLEGRLLTTGPERQRRSIPSITACELLNASEAAAMCGVSRATWYRLLCGMRAPQAIKLGRRSLWDARELRLWIAARCPRYHVWAKERQRLGMAQRRQADITEAIGATGDKVHPRRCREPVTIVRPSRIALPRGVTDRAS